MEVTDIDETQELVPTVAHEAPTAAYEHCDQCGAPVDHSQRYCVECGLRRRGAYDPAARYLSTTAARPRAVAPAAAPSRRRAPGLGFALVLAVIPLAVGLGVLVGRSSSNGDQKLIAALSQQKPEVIQGSSAATGSAGSSSSTPAATLTSNFPLQSGYTVELETLPGHGTTQSTVNAAESTARSKGAKAVGLITQSDYHVTPAPPRGDYVIYAGAYHTQSQAQAELAQVRHSFPKATVVAVRSVSASAGAGQVLAKTSYGTAHQITGFHATPAQLAQGAQIVNKVAKTIGHSYIDSQKGLPDQISVP